MTKPDKSLIEVDTEDDYSTDTRHIQISLDIHLAIFIAVVSALACVGSVLLILQR